jgi:hypothetical protein
MGTRMVNTPAGAFFIDDTATPEAIARARADFLARNKPTKPGTVNVKPLTAEEKEAKRRVDFGKKHGLGSSGLERMFTNGITSNFMDNIGSAVNAATFGTARAIKKGDVGEIGKEYRISQLVEKARDKEAANGTGGTIAEIAGALANPIGTGSTALKAMTFSPRAVKIGKALDEAPAVVQGIAAGSLQGGLNALGASDGDLGKAGQGFLAGGIGGGAMGGVASGVRRGVQILRDRAPEAAERVAHTRIGNMLDNSGKTPAQIEREMAVSKARGGDPMLMDMTPGLRAQAGALSRRPDVPTSNKMIERGEARILDRPAKYEQKLREHITPSTGTDAAAHTASVHGARKAHGDLDYKAALDGKFHWNDSLQKVIDDVPEMQAAMRDGAKLASLYDQDIGKLGMRVGPDGAVTLDATPSMRVFDYAKRAMDAKIAAAYKSGDNALAGGLSNQLTKFKTLITDANPQYAAALAKQRDYFQRAEATELGMSVVSRLKSEPKAVLAELRALDPTKYDDARTGIADAMIALRAQKQDPVAFFKGLARTPEQRKVLEFAFNGKGNLSRFERWLDRELRAKKADVLTAPGRQSETARFAAADDSLEGVGGVAEHGLRGFAFGGPAGASAAVMRKFSDLKNGMSPSALDAMAKALMGDGSGIAGKVTLARKYAKTRKKQNAKAAVRAAKAGQQPITNYAGEE